MQILDADGQPAAARQEGTLAHQACPCPPGSLPTLWQNDARLRRRPTSARYPGYYFTGDGGYIDEDGYVFIMGRVDDVINVAGHRLSTGAHGGGRSPRTRTWPSAP